MKAYDLTLRASDNAVVDISVPKGLYDAATTGEAVEIERWEGHVTKLYRDGTEHELVRLRESKGEIRAGFAILVVLTVLVLVKTQRARKRLLAKHV